MIRKLPLLSLLLPVALLLVAGWQPAIAAPLVGLSIVDREHGAELPEYRARGETWIAGAPGHRYAVRLRNDSSERVLVVLSVDGVNAVSGETAAASQTGYVLGPWETADIAGWRKSLDDIAGFVFTDLPDAYAARTGRPDNVGVIGIAVFRERQTYLRPASPPVVAQRDASAGKVMAEAAPAASANAAPQRLGTGHGEREWAPVGSTQFVRAGRTPAQVTQLRYDDAATLIALGVLPRHTRPWQQAPRAFPGGFVPDPPRG
jgi:hypothetical protein